MDERVTQAVSIGLDRHRRLQDIRKPEASYDVQLQAHAESQYD
jgi:hypothetical protein